MVISEIEDDPRSGRPKTATSDEKVMVMPHPPYSPDLAPADFFFFLFPKAKGI